jgi:hypothetical protein
MVQHVRILAVLMMANGAINCLIGLALAIGLPLLLGMENKNQARHDPAEATVMWVIFGGLGFLVGLFGLFSITAGFFCFRFRARTFVLISIFSNVVIFLLAGLFGFLSIALMIYGLVVMFNPEVARAFRRAAQGFHVDDVGPDRDYRQDEEFDDWDRRPRHLERERFDD